MRAAGLVRRHVPARRLSTHRAGRPRSRRGVQRRLQRAGRVRGSDAAARRARSGRASRTSAPARARPARGMRGCEALEGRVVAQQIVAPALDRREPRVVVVRTRRPAGERRLDRARDRCRASACRCTASAAAALRAREMPRATDRVDQPLRQFELGEALADRAPPAPRPGPAARASRACDGSSTGRFGGGRRGRGVGARHRRSRAAGEWVQESTCFAMITDPDSPRPARASPCRSANALPRPR